MTNISRDSDVVELNTPPFFNYGEKVRAKRSVRNDGTCAGREIGDILVKKGEEGYVVSIGTFLQQFYIYGATCKTIGTHAGISFRDYNPG